MQTSTDHLAGFIMRGKKYDLTTKQEVPAGFLNVYVYETDSYGDPKQNGTKIITDTKTGKKTEVPNYNIVKSYRVPISTLYGVVTGEKRKCQFYWSEPPKSEAQEIRELKAQVAALKKK